MSPNYNTAYYEKFVRTPTFKFKINILYHLWIAYFCLIKPSQITKDAKILDFGCGIGNQVRALRLLGYNAVGVDYSEQAKPFCVDKDHCFYMTFQQMKFKNNCFDLVFSNEVLEHLTKKELVYYLNELYRVSKGIMIHMIGVKDRGNMVVNDSTHKTVQKENWWKNFFIRQGFQVTNGNWFYFFPTWRRDNPFMKGQRSGYFIISKKK